MNLATLLTRAAGVAADRPAVQVGSTTVASYAALADRAGRLAGGLRRTLAEGERVALAMKNCAEYVEALFGIWHAGLAAVPMNAKLHTMEFDYMLAHSGARVVFVTPDMAATVGACPAVQRGEVQVVETGSAEWGALFAADPLPLVPRGQDDLAWLFYTSGTTGRPKGAMLSNRNLLTMTACYFMDVDGIAATDALLHAAPMSHGSGLYILPHVAAMARQVIPESGGFEADEILDLLPHQPGLSFFAAPTMVHRLTLSPRAGTADTRNLKTIVYGGGPMYVADCKQAMAVFGPKLAQIYGQGESPMTITALSKALHAEAAHPRHEERLASAGVRQSLVEVRIGGEDGSPLPVGATGEVLVRGPSVMLGYWDNPQATAATVRDGWLHTGDVGALDADGFLTLKDRSKDVIISGGSNIYPREVEEVLLTHPSVREVSVVGQPHPEWGEEVVAFVVPAGGRPPRAEELDALCLSAIARFKRPKRYRFVEILPKNNYGKVLKTELRRMLAQEAGGVSE